jgi:hypothetical protein
MPLLKLIVKLLVSDSTAKTGKPLSRKRCSDVNAKDYRAWYGLGQAYELLDMPMYAIEYYNQATALRSAYRDSVREWS